MDDLYLDAGHTGITIDNPDPIIANAAPEKKHSVHFEIAPGHTVSVALTDGELNELYRKVLKRIFHELGAEEVRNG